MTRAGINITLLLAGATASMPVIMVGHILAENYGTLFALLTVLAGNAVLCAIGFLTVHLALKYKTTTTDTVIALGGSTLSKVFSVAMVVSMLGWFCVQCSVLVDFAHGYFPSMPHVLLTLLIGITLVLAAMGDIKRLLWLAQRLGPLLLLGCSGMFVWALSNTHVVEAKEAVAFWPSFSLVIAVNLSWVIDVPTFYRGLSSQKEGFVSIFVVMFVATTMVQALGVLLVSSYDSVGLLMSPFGVVLALSGWLINVNNLYSAVVSSQTIIKTENFARRSVLLGALALVLVCMHVSDSLVTFIEAITLGISSMGGVMAVCAIVRFRNEIALAVSWCLGLASGALSLASVLTLTGAAQVDAFLSACIFAILALYGVQLWQSQLSPKNS